jgi:pilus assembly protein CpaC
MNNKTFLISPRTPSMKPLYLLCGLSLSAVTVPALAQQAPNAGESRAQQATAAREIKLVMGAQHELNLPGGVERIAIGDDTIAAVHIKRAGKGLPPRSC